MQHMCDIEHVAPGIELHESSTCATRYKLVESKPSYSADPHIDSLNDIFSRLPFLPVPSTFCCSFLRFFSSLSRFPLSACKIDSPHVTSHHASYERRNLRCCCEAQLAAAATLVCTCGPDSHIVQQDAG